MDGFETPERTEDAFRLLDSARSYRQLAAEATAPAAAAFFHIGCDGGEPGRKGIGDESER